MGNFLNDYRQAIDLFNSVKICFCGMSICDWPVSIMSLMCTVIILLLLLSNDIELNPGPVKLKSLSICHVNIRGLSDSKLRVTRKLQLQATVKRFQFDLHLNLEGQHMLVNS